MFIFIKCADTPVPGPGGEGGDVPACRGVGVGEGGTDKN